MNCDCDRPSAYFVKIVKVRKPHKCCECGLTINQQERAEKADGIYDGEFRTFYTCLDCLGILNFLKPKFPEALDCHGELADFLSESGFLYSKTEIEREARNVLPNYDKTRGVVRGSCCVIAPLVPWLVHQNGKFRLVEDC